MKFNQQKILQSVRVKARPKSLLPYVALMVWIGEENILNIRCNDPAFKYGLYRFPVPHIIAPDTEVSGLVSLDHDAPAFKKGTNPHADFALIFRTPNE